MGRDPSFAKNIQFDFIQNAKPSGPDVTDGVSWWDTGASELKVYNGSTGTWEKTGVVNHAELTSVTEGQHRSTSQVKNYAVTAVENEAKVAANVDKLDGKDAADIGGGATGTNPVKKTHSFSSVGGGTTNGTYTWQADLWCSGYKLNTNQGGAKLKVTYGNGTVINEQHGDGWYTYPPGFASSVTVTNTSDFSMDGTFILYSGGVVEHTH